jgi:SAM-dependent methyltransferase
MTEEKALFPLSAEQRLFSVPCVYTMKHKIPDGSEVYWDGAHYDLHSGVGAPADLPFYLAEAGKAGGPVLELACGTGRLTIPMAKAGVDITGLDVSGPMLERARSKAAAEGIKVKFVRADIRKLGLNGRFRLIFIAFNSMQHLHDRLSLERFLAGVRKHLAPGGRFILDVFNPDPRYLVRGTEELLPIGYYKNPRTGTDILVNERYSYDRAAQTSRIVWYYKAGRRAAGRRTLNMRCFYPAELEALLHYNGFRIVRKYGGFDRALFAGASQRQIVVCRKA